MVLAGQHASSERAKVRGVKSLRKRRRGFAGTGHQEAPGLGMGQDRLPDLFPGGVERPGVPDAECPKAPRSGKWTGRPR